MQQSYLSYHESEKVEFKEKANDGLKKDILAFANGEGGRIYIGVQDDRAVVGLEDADAELRKISNWVRDLIKPDLSLFMHYEIQELAEVKFLLVEVSRGTNRPYYLAAKGLRPEGVYVRQGTSSVPATDTEIRKMIKSTDGDRYEEMRSLQQELTFQQIKEEFAKKNLGFEDLDQVNLKLKTIDGVYTNLGYLLSDQCEHSVKVAVIEGEDEMQFRDRREFSGSLLQQLHEIYNYLDMRNKLHSKFEKLWRIDQRDYPEVAIREALLNLLVHRDYGISASALITLYEDRVEFVSVGGLPDGVEKEDILLGLSVCRNQNLANIFYRLELIEAYGTGIRKIIKAYAGAERKPEFITTANAFKLVLPNLNQGGEERKEQFKIEESPGCIVLGECSDPYIIENIVNLTEEEIKLLDWLKEKGSITRAEAEEILDVAPATAFRWLKKLMDKKYIHQKGHGRRTHYII